MISLIAYALAPRLGARMATVTAWALTIGLAFLALYLAYCWAWDQGRDHERAKWEAAAELLEDADAAADAEALDVAHDMKGQVDATNQRARDAAAASDDPLAAGIGELRRQGGGQGDQAAK
ncbi:hypothetical protein [Sphingopyxis macrogoltabida]|uniref:Uncharacterized protein n=1 Tax=Sphingopyxis macrogoltabida TaxID=33050 RepID=A0AAC9AVN0_SPHMC|nr:hypothetical protein [Sphingopyxis macrogoltabida]ALJ14141.1 hypothetical protein LH19_14805 [Sphingopyxis macrogoltabida]AMU90407.1 hypothetical protein ATM17_15380 [Sphingopyxis macrogoltabida]